ncbi:trypsin-like peptidase domain-containing protein [Gemmatimonas aurantiaca]|uniref:trypsin-like peptidase domain-containing protein n=1 Tax=Gemmatimonas aurantiaca TaxID=173480 RepID=UPI00301E3175
MERVVLRHLKGSKASQLEEFPLEQFAELTIGRDPSAGVRFDPDKDDLVGRQHARIARDANDPYRFTLTDLNSRNGTFLNKLRVVGDRPLQPGDVIQLGAGGPELQFDIDPLPAMYVKATRLGGAVAGVAETRVGAPPAASGSSGSGGTGNAPAPTNSIGKATVERMIGETRNQGRRNMFAVLGVAAALIIGVVGYNRLQADKLEEQGGKTKARLDSLGKATGRAGELSKQLQPAEIAAAHSPAVVQVDFSWKLTHRGSGGQVYHRLVPNVIKMRDGSRRPIVDNGRQMVPAYVQVGSAIEPALTLDQNAGEPIGVSSRGSGFVVTSNGFIITNRHVAYNWQTWYRFNPNDVGPILDGRTGQPMLDEGGNPVVTRPPGQWIPSETKQAGPKGDIGDFQARVEYLYVRFPKDPTPFEAANVRPSQRHDVALIKVDAPQALSYVNMEDTYDKTRQGDAVTVMGYPGVSDEVITVIKSRDMFNREAQQRILPDPTLSTGNIGKILRAADTEVRDGFITLAPGGDTYQLTINSTGGGNSGGPMFDAFGNVIGIYFAGKTTDAQISFAIPIRYAMELLKIGDPTAR